MSRWRKEKKKPPAIYKYFTMMFMIKKPPTFLEKKLFRINKLFYGLFWGKGYVLVPLKVKSSVSFQLCRCSIKKRYVGITFQLLLGSFSSVYFSLESFSGHVAIVSFQLALPPCSHYTEFSYFPAPAAGRRAHERRGPPPQRPAPKPRRRPR